MSASAYPWFPLDHHIENFNVAYTVVKSGSGDVTYNVQKTLNNLEPHAINVSAVSALATDLFGSAAATTAAGITVPAVAIRVNVLTVSGTSNLTFQVLQAGN